MKKKITLKHIAKELDVSVSTVSKALKNSEEIGKDTKEKIQAFAKLYNYRPNNIALSLKNKRTKNIGVIIPDIVHHFFATVIRGIEKFANNKGYNVIICVSNESYEKEVINMEMLTNGSIDGFIMALSAGTEKKKKFNHLEEVKNLGLPIVLFDRVTDEIDCDKVVNNDIANAHEAVIKLMESGKKRIGLFACEKYYGVSGLREQGYRKAHVDKGVSVNENLILRLDLFGMDDYLISDFFKKHQVDALLCVNETYAARAIKGAILSGHKVPQDISIIGYTDGILSKYSSPSLTTIDQHGELMGIKATELLINRIENDDESPFHTEIVKGTLIKRESTLF